MISIILLSIIINYVSANNCNKNINGSEIIVCCNWKNVNNPVWLLNDSIITSKTENGGISSSVERNNQYCLRVNLNDLTDNVLYTYRLESKNDFNVTSTYSIPIKMTSMVIPIFKSVTVLCNTRNDRLHYMLPNDSNWYVANKSYVDTSTFDRIYRCNKSFDRLLRITRSDAILTSMIFLILSPSVFVAIVYVVLRIVKAKINTIHLCILIFIDISYFSMLLTYIFMIYDFMIYDILPEYANNNTYYL